MLKSEIKVFVGLIFYWAKVDKTVPNRRNLRSGWLTDTLLTKIIDAYVTGNDPAAYAEIARRVLKKIQNLPENENLSAIVVLLKLAVLRGLRLLPLIPERVELVIELSEDLKSGIRLLPKGTRKQRCLELYSYHMGVFYDTLGYFDQAVEMYGWSVRQAGSRSSSAAISRYCAALSRLKQALLVGRPPNEQEALFSDLEEKFVRLTKALRGSELQVQWECNCSVQIISMLILLNRQHDKQEEWAETALSTAGQLGWNSAAEFVLAVSGAEEKLVAFAEKGGGDNEKAIALLLLARKALADGKRGEARRLVNLMPMQGAQYARAVAERMLKD